MTDTPALTVDYPSLKRRVARILAFPEDESRWSESQQHEVDEMIKEGLRMVYGPVEVDQFGQHSWSFFHPTTELTTNADQQWYKLGLDFDHLDQDGQVFFVAENQHYDPIAVVSESYLLMQNTRSESTSHPRLAAVRTHSTGGATPPYSEIGFFPIPDSEYRISYTYYAVPYMISEDRPYPLGGITHGHLILLACEAAAERYENDGPGPHYQMFLKQLQTDIKRDARRAGVHHGYNANGLRFLFPSRSANRRAKNVFQSNVTYNGSLYNG